MIWIMMVILLLMGFAATQQNATWEKPQKKNVKEYQGQLILKVFYGRTAQSAVGDFTEFEKNGRIFITYFATEEITNEVQRQIQGKWVDAGQAVVRVIEETGEIVSWTYIR